MKTRGFNFSSFLKNNVAWVILILICVIFAAINPRFLTFRNIRTVLDQNAYLVVASCGIVLIQMAGDLDISIGYQIYYWSCMRNNYDNNKHSSSTCYYYRSYPWSCNECIKLLAC